MNTVMKFGIFGGIGAIQSNPEYRCTYNSYIDSIIKAENLGFHSNFLVEHHFTGMGQVSASLNLLTFLAAKTNKIRLGTAVIVLPWHNPILIAEQVSTLDLLSEGRFDFGIGKGYRYSEFDGFCIPMEEADELFQESLSVLRKAWASPERFSHSGKRWKFKNIIVEPTPIQKPHPPFWIAAGQTQSIQYAAEENFNLLLDQFQTFDVISNRFNIYKDMVSEAGGSWSANKVAVARALYITNNRNERDAAITARITQLKEMNARGISPNGQKRSSMVSDDDLLKATEHGVLIGSPDEIIDKINLLRSFGISYILLSPQTKNAIEIFSDQIMPSFNETTESTK